MSGVFGGAMLVAFFFQFDSTVMMGEKIDEAREGRKSQRWFEALLSMTGRFSPGLGLGDYKKVWEGTKGIRFLVPLGAALCAISYFTYRIWLKKS